MKTACFAIDLVVKHAVLRCNMAGFALYYGCYHSVI